MILYLRSEDGYNFLGLYKEQMNEDMSVKGVKGGEGDA